jgi:hypothetical protein
MSKRVDQDYHETLTGVRNEIEARLEAAGAVLKSPYFYSHYDQSFHDGVSYGQVKRADTELAELKRKPTRKWAHATVTRLETGRYELVFYIL